MNFRRLPETALPAAIVGCAIVAIVAIRNTAGAAQSWFAAYLFWTGIPVGALYLVLVHGLTGGQWGLTLRPALSAMLRSLPLTALFLIPVLLGATRIYPWTVGGHGIWLDRPFFSVRAIIYVVLWNAIGLGVLRRVKPDGWLPPGFAWPALVLLFASTSLAAFDWLMTLEPGWTSTIFGLLIGAGWALSAIAAAVLIVAVLSRPNLTEPLDAPARILLAVLFLWAYLSAVQLIVIWESDLSDEIPWYLHRIAGGWQWWASGIAVFQFAVPFLILMWQPLRRSPLAVLIATASILLAHLGEIWWLTIPDFGRALGWIDPLAVIAVGAAFFYVAGHDFGPYPGLPAIPNDAAD